MRYLKVLFLSVLGTVVASCQSSDVKEPSNETVTAQAPQLNVSQLQQLLMARYQVIAGAWYVNL